MLYSVFPKFLPHLEPRILGETLKRCGLDACNLVVREDFWVEPGNIPERAPGVVSALREAGLKVELATMRVGADEIGSRPEMLEQVAELGVKAVRFGYFQSGSDDAWGLARRGMEKVARAAQRAGIKAVVHVHQGTLITDSTAALKLVDGLPVEHVGVMLDPGNQYREGWEDFGAAMDRLGPYHCAWGVKDWRVPHRDSPGAWVPCGEDGCIDWPGLFHSMAARDFDGTLVFMPFYDGGNPERLVERLAREVAFIRAAEAAAYRRESA